MTLPLHTLQQRFIQAITSGETDPLEAMLTTHPKLTPEEHMQLYRRNVQGAILHAMALTYPIVEQLVGEEFFAFAVQQYRKRHLPSSGNLDQYGAEFSAFLAEFTPASSLPYLPAMAELEWAFHQSALAEQATPLSADALNHMAPEDYATLCFTTHPSLKLLHADYPVDAIWEFHQKLEEGTATEPLDISETGAVYLALVRPRTQVHLHTLSPAEYHFVSALQTQQTLYQGFQHASQEDPEFDLAFSLHRFMVNGMLVDMHHTPI